MGVQIGVKNPGTLYGREKKVDVLGVSWHAKTQHEITFDWLHTLSQRE
jgi:hypothetical protein